MSTCGSSWWWYCFALQICAVCFKRFIGLIYPESFKAEQIRTTEMSPGWNSQRQMKYQCAFWMRDWILWQSWQIGIKMELICFLTSSLARHGGHCVLPAATKGDGVEVDVEVGHPLLLLLQVQLLLRLQPPPLSHWASSTVRSLKLKKQDMGNSWRTQFCWIDGEYLFGQVIEEENLER